MKNKGNFLTLYTPKEEEDVICERENNRDISVGGWKEKQGLLFGVWFDFVENFS